MSPDLIVDGWRHVRAAPPSVWSWWVRLTVEHPGVASAVAVEAVAVVVLAILVSGRRGRHRS